MGVRIDKIASSTVNLSLPREVSLAPRCGGEAGTVCLVRALEEKRVYDQVELATGRMAKISRGDIIAGVLGARRALQGFVGTVPGELNRGDRLHVLNLGGVIGRAVSYNREYGPPLEVEFLGAVQEGGKVLNIADRALKTVDLLESDLPLVAVAGTSMNSGKTEVAARATQELTWKGLRVCSAKVSGISALRDMLNMEDHGAVKALSFLDFGYPSTVRSPDVPRIAKGAIAELARYRPDLVILELGDGLLGDYGVMEFFRDGQLREQVRCNIVCALDPVGAWGIQQLLDQEDIPVHLMAGPVTDNDVGLEFLRDRLGLKGLNALYQQEELGAFIRRAVGL